MVAHNDTNDGSEWYQWWFQILKMVLNDTINALQWYYGALHCLGFITTCSSTL